MVLITEVRFLYTNAIQAVSFGQRQSPSNALKTCESPRKLSFIKAPQVIILRPFFSSSSSFSHCRTPITGAIPHALILQILLLKLPLHFEIRLPLTFDPLLFHVSYDSFVHHLDG